MYNTNTYNDLDNRNFILYSSTASISTSGTITLNDNIEKYSIVKFQTSEGCFLMPLASIYKSDTKIEFVNNNELRFKKIEFTVGPNNSITYTFKIYSIYNYKDDILDNTLSTFVIQNIIGII
jgi:hypothetical protein